MELVANHLEKSYGGPRALRGVDLRLQPGVSVLLGPNGSGKSTLLRLLATAAKPDRGQINFGGRPYTDDLRPLRRVLGYVPQHLDLPGHMTARAFLHFVARLKDVPAEPQASTLLHDLGLGDEIDRRLATLSGGQRRLAAIAQALLGHPRLLVFDEPLVGLDVDERLRVLRQLTGLGKRQIVILGSHVPAHVEAIASQVIVLQAGMVVASGSPEELRGLATGKVRTVDVPVDAVDRLLANHLVSRVTMGQGRAQLRIVGSLPPWLAGDPVEPTLEDAYLLLVQNQTPVLAGQATD